MYFSHAHCDHESTTEARRQCREGRQKEQVISTDKATLMLKPMGGSWRDTYEIIEPAGDIVGVLTKVDFLQEVRTRRGLRSDRVTEYRMEFRRCIDPARLFEGKGSRKITEALEMASRAYSELTC